MFYLGVFLYFLVSLCVLFAVFLARLSKHFSPCQALASAQKDEEKPLGLPDRWTAAWRLICFGGFGSKVLYALGVLGVLLTTGVFFQDRYGSHLVKNHYFLGHKKKIGHMLV